MDTSTEAGWMNALRALLTASPDLTQLQRLLARWPAGLDRATGLEEARHALVTHDTPWASALSSTETSADAFLAEIDTYRPRHLLADYQASGQALDDLRGAWEATTQWRGTSLTLKADGWSHGEFGPRWSGEVDARSPTALAERVRFQADFRVFLYPFKVGCQMAEVRFANDASAALEQDVEALLRELEQTFGEEAVLCAWERLGGDAESTAPPTRGLGHTLRDPEALGPLASASDPLREIVAQKLREILEEGQEDAPELIDAPPFVGLALFLDVLEAALRGEGRTPPDA